MEKKGGGNKVGNGNQKVQLAGCDCGFLTSSGKKKLKPPKPEEKILSSQRMRKALISMADME